MQEKALAGKKKKKKERQNNRELLEVNLSNFTVLSIRKISLWQLNSHDLSSISPFMLSCSFPLGTSRTGTFEAVSRHRVIVFFLAKEVTSIFPRLLSWPTVSPPCLHKFSLNSKGSVMKFKCCTPLVSKASNTGQFRVKNIFLSLDSAYCTGNFG